MLLAAACRGAAPAPPSVASVDFIAEFERAEKRPPSAYRIADYRIGETAHPSIIAPAPGRLTWAMRLPRRGVLQARVTLADPPAGSAPAAVQLRIGISDDRIYEPLHAITLEPPDRHWRDVAVDLSAYAGRKWSLFYRPDRITWRIVFAADAVGGAPGVVAWGAPRIVTDEESAREYRQRLTQLPPSYFTGFEYLPSSASRSAAASVGVTSPLTISRFDSRLPYIAAFSSRSSRRVAPVSATPANAPRDRE